MKQTRREFLKTNAAAATAAVAGITLPGMQQAVAQVTLSGAQQALPGGGEAIPNSSSSGYGGALRGAGPAGPGWGRASLSVDRVRDLAVPDQKARRQGTRGRSLRIYWAPARK